MLSGQWHIIKNKPLKYIVNTLDYLKEKKRKNEAWDVWIAKYPNMTKENFETFQEFWNRLNIKVSTRSKEEILKESEEIQRKINEKKNKSPTPET